MEWPDLTEMNATERRHFSDLLFHMAVSHIRFRPAWCRDYNSLNCRICRQIEMAYRDAKKDAASGEQTSLPNL